MNTDFTVKSTGSGTQQTNTDIISMIWNIIFSCSHNLLGSTGYNPIGSVVSRVGSLNGSYNIQASNIGVDTLVKIEPTHDLDFDIMWVLYPVYL